MSREFETMVMAIYAELCVKWRIAFIAGRGSAAQIEAQLGSLEEVIEVFRIGLGEADAASGEPTAAAAHPAKVTTFEEPTGLRALVSPNPSQELGPAGGEPVWEARPRSSRPRPTVAEFVRA